MVLLVTPAGWVEKKATERDNVFMLLDVVQMGVELVVNWMRLNGYNCCSLQFALPQRMREKSEWMLGCWIMVQFICDGS